MNGQQDMMQPFEIAGLSEQQKDRGFQLFDDGKAINIHLNGTPLTCAAIILNNRQSAIETAKYLVDIYDQVYTCACDAGWTNANREGK